MPKGRKRYAQVGIGSRSAMFTNAIVDSFSNGCELVALCDTNQGRMDLRNRQIADKCGPVPTWKAEEFDTMIEQAKPDVVIVTTVDATHSDYICRAMELGCDVITEKPMTTDEAKSQRILDTQKRTGRMCTSQLTQLRTLQWL